MLLDRVQMTCLSCVNVRVCKKGAVSLDIYIFIYIYTLYYTHINILFKGAR